MHEKNKTKPRKKVLSDPENAGYVPPQSIEIEESVLGAVLLESTALDGVISDFSEKLFYKEENQLIARAILTLYKQSKPIDMLTVLQELKRNNHLELIGGNQTVIRLTDRIASASNIYSYVKILQEHSLRRSIILTCSQAMKKAYDNHEDSFDTYNELQVNLDGELKELVHYEVQSVGSVHEQILSESIMICSTGAKSGVESGLAMVDNLTSGWQKSDLIILAGRSGMGKTSGAISFILFPAIEQKKAVAIFSCEMSKAQLVSRMQSSLSGVNVSKIVKKQLDLDEIYVIKKECESLLTAPIFIDDTPAISLLELKSKARKLKKENNIEIIIIDYLQLMRSGLNLSNREQEVAEISKGLKALAKELDIPIIALSQLSRQVENRAGTDKKPQLSDLRESGQIEQDADMVLFCYRPEYYGIETYEIGNETFETRGLFMLIVAKHRNGELGEIPLKFLHEQTKLVNHPYKNYVPPEPQKREQSTPQSNNQDFLNQTNEPAF